MNAKKLYRGKLLGCDKWAEGFYFEAGGQSFITPRFTTLCGFYNKNFIDNFAQVDPETVGQQITVDAAYDIPSGWWEGDLYRWWQYLVVNNKQGHKEHISVITSDIRDLFFFLNRIEGGRGVEKLGNKWDNPELLKVKE